MKVEFIGEKMTTKGVAVFSVGLSAVCGYDDLAEMLKDAQRAALLDAVFADGLQEEGPQVRPFKAVELPESALFEVLDLTRAESEDGEATDGENDRVSLVVLWKGFSVAPDPADPAKAVVALKGSVGAVSNATALALREFIDGQYDLLPTWQDRQLDLPFGEVPPDSVEAGDLEKEEMKPTDGDGNETVETMNFPADPEIPVTVKRRRGRPRKTNEAEEPKSVCLN